MDSILPVVSADGESKIGALNEVGRSVLQERTFIAGEPLHIDQLYPRTHSSQPRNVSTCSAGLDLGVHPGQCRGCGFRASAGAAPPDSAGSCAHQSAPDPDVELGGLGRGQTMDATLPRGVSSACKIASHYGMR